MKKQFEKKKRLYYTLHCFITPYIALEQHAEVSLFLNKLKNVTKVRS